MRIAIEQRRARLGRRKGGGRETARPWLALGSIRTCLEHRRPMLPLIDERMATSLRLGFGGGIGNEARAAASRAGPDDRHEPLCLRTEPMYRMGDVPEK